MTKMNYFAATAVASKIAKVDVKELRAACRKGGKPTGNMLNAVIVARQLMNGTFERPVQAEAVAEA